MFSAMKKKFSSLYVVMSLLFVMGLVGVVFWGFSHNRYSHDFDSEIVGRSGVSGMSSRDIHEVKGRDRGEGGVTGVNSESEAAKGAVASGRVVNQRDRDAQGKVTMFEAIAGEENAADLAKEEAKDSAVREASVGWVRSRDMRMGKDMLPDEAGVWALEEGDTLRIPLFDDAVYDVTVNRKREDRGIYSLTGTIEGRETRTVNFVVAGGEARLELQDMEARKLFVAYARGGDIYRVDEFDLTQTAERKDERLMLHEDMEGVAMADAVAPDLSRVTLDAAGDPIVDVMLVYDTSGKKWVDGNGGMSAFSAAVINKMNLASENSGGKFSFRLAHAVATTYTAKSVGGQTSLSPDLMSLSNGEGGLSGVAQLRQSYKADLVAMLVDTGTPYGYVGVGWLLGNATGNIGTGFTVNAIRSVNQTHTLTHEVGHNMGAHHSKNQTADPGPNTRLNNYSAGWYFTGNNNTKYHTIMAYNADGYGNYYDEAPYFSTPNKNYAGKPVGHAADGDNTRCMNDTAPYVSAYFAAGPEITINPSTVTMGYAGGSQVVSVTCAADWTVTTDEDWINLSKTATSATLVVSENTGLARTGTVKFTPQGGTPVIVTVNQSMGRNVTMRLTIPADGGTSEIGTIKGMTTMTATLSCPTPIPSWITPSSARVQVGYSTTIANSTTPQNFTFITGVDALVSASASANGTNLDRTWTMKITTAQNEFTVIFVQPRKPKPVALAPSFTTVPAGKNTFQNQMVVSMTSATPGAAIYYTLNGTRATEQSTLYSGPITLTATTTVRAVAISDATSLSAETQATYQKVDRITPENDDFLNARIISGSSGESISESNIDATKETGEPDHGNNGATNSLWWRWTAPAAGDVTFDTNKSGTITGGIRNTILAIYKGSSLVTLQLVGSDDYSGDGELSKLTFRAERGVTYSIVVTGFYNKGQSSLTSGIIGLSWKQVIIPQTATPAFVPGEGMFDNSVSVRLQCTTPGAVIYYTTDYSLPTTSSSVYSGPIVVDKTTTIMAMSLAPGCDTSNLSTATYTKRPVPPMNDDFASAKVLSGNTGSVTGTNIDATTEDNEPIHGGQATGHSVWWKWTAPSTGKLTVDTVGSGFDTMLSIYRGSMLSSLVQTASNDNGEGIGSASSVTFDVTSGMTYYVCVSGVQNAFGSIALNWSFVGAPSLTVSDSTINFASIGGTKTVTITSNVDWTITMPSASWISMEGSTTGNGTATRAFIVNVNPNTTTRQATITVSGTGVTARTITIKQDGDAVTMDDWVKQYWGVNVQPGAEGTKPQDNPSGDGISNLMKYALSMDPFKKASGTGTLGKSTQGGKEYMTLTYTINPKTVGVRYAAEFSNDGGKTWTETRDVTPSAGATTLTITDSEAIGVRAQRLMRMRVTLTE